MMSKTFFAGSLLISCLVFSVATCASEQDREQRQAELDSTCEKAREERLAPERERYIEECVEKEQKPDRAACERFYRDYGARSGDRAPLYYDLPECVEAFEFRKSHKTR